MEKKPETIELELTWEELEEQRIVNIMKDNPPKKRIKKFV